MNKDQYEAIFAALTGNKPFPWQVALYERFEKGDIPASCNLPTGLGKTSVIAVWLIALAFGAKVPRRLVYVVNRRTVVDQTTEEVEKYKKHLDEKPELAETKAKLGSLALSTLRGQFADNREWSADPSRPAVICGTVDMIGSRLLFSGYGLGMRAKPLHAGFLGQDALLVHDEAHLEPAFQTLIESIECEQKRCKEFGTFKVMALTATSRGAGEVFELTPEEKTPPAELPTTPELPIHYVWQRLASKKGIELYPVENEKQELVPKVVERGLKHKDDPAKPAVLIFVRTVEAVNEVVKGLKSGKVADGNVETLTGTMRGLEREKMATESKVFKRFKKDSPAEEQPGTVYLVCTAAGEVGVDMSADHMVCDLSTYDSMAQRFGRVNRYGTGDARIDIVHPEKFDTKDKPFEIAREKTLKLLDGLRRREDGLRDASPASLSEILERAIREGSGGSKDPADRAKALREYVLSAFAPPPTILPATDILFDAWALTTIKDKLPGRPKVEPYLHGLPTDWQPPETQVAWREEVSVLNVKPWIEWTPKERDKFATELLELYPLKPPEVLKDVTARVFERLKKMKLPAETPLWLQEEDGAVSVTTFGRIVAGDKEDLHYLTVILPRTAGGLNAQGMLDEKATDTVPDASEEVFADRERKHPLRIRLWSTAEGLKAKTEDYRLLRSIPFPGPEGDEDEVGKVWLWFALDNEGDKSAKDPVEWCVHVADVERYAAAIVDKLPLGDLREVVKLAAKFHDHGKLRKLFQTVLGNPKYPEVKLAKSGKTGGRVTEKYRHEFGSLVDVELKKLLHSVALLDADGKELVLHLIAAHHGRGRPHFPADEAFDPDGHTAIAERIARETPRRFARLQRKYGRWGLAYLESLLRAADWAASGNPSGYLTKEDTK